MKRAGFIIGIGFALLIVGGLIAVAFIDEPLRRYIERQANEKLDGYELSIAGLDLHPASLSIDLEGVVLTRTTGGRPQLLEVPHWTASVHWADLLRGEIVSDLDMQHPIIRLPRTTEERAGKKLEAWQDAVTSVYPITINRLVVHDGLVLYGGKSAGEPIRLEHIDVEAGHIRNVESKPSDHPSELHVSAQLFEQGLIQMDGLADFFAKPNPAFDVDVRLQEVQLKHLLPVIGQYNVQLRSGALDMTGRMQHSRHATVLAIDTFLLEGARFDYVHAATKGTERKRVQKGVEVAKQAYTGPTVLLKVGHGKILNSEMGFVNKAASPDYRVFITDMNVDLDSVSNRLEEGTGVVKMTGKFMGSGPTVVTGRFRPEKPRPDFDLEVKIIKTQVKSFNKLLQAHGDIDTMSGTFAFFSELSVKDNRIDGYVKPFLKDVEVYDPAQDNDKAFTHKVYEAVIGGVLGLFENAPRDETATVAEVSGTIDDPQARTWQIVGKLVQNAFFEAILPGFEGRMG